MAVTGPQTDAVGRGKIPGLGGNRRSLEKGHYLRIPSDLAVAIDDDHCLIPWLDRVGDGGCGGWGWCGGYGRDWPGC